jgi:putative holin|nr:MAG TPA: hypothetical protein [Caudoviricetes sp.]
MISLPQTLDVALVIGVITLVTIIGKFVYRFTRFLDHLSVMLSTWEGTPDRPGVVARLDDIEDKLKDVQYHVKPNHGGSTIDAQNRQLKEILSYLREKDNGKS